MAGGRASRRSQRRVPKGAELRIGASTPPSSLTQPGKVPVPGEPRTRRPKPGNAGRYSPSEGRAERSKAGAPRSSECSTGSSRPRSGCAHLSRGSRWSLLFPAQPCRGAVIPQTRGIQGHFPQWNRGRKVIIKSLRHRRQRDALETAKCCLHLLWFSGNRL